MASKAVGYTNPKSRTSYAFLSFARQIKPICNRNIEGINHGRALRCRASQRRRSDYCCLRKIFELNYIRSGLGIAKTDVDTIKGHKSRYKTVLITNLRMEDVKGYLVDVKRKLQGVVAG